MTDDQAAARRRMIDASREAGARWDFRERFAELERSCHRLRTGPFEATFEDYCYQSMWERYWLKRDCRTGDDYANFLQSDLWRKSIRPRVLKRDNRVCFSCGGRANDVHHASYHPLVMAGSADEWLFSVCRTCHDSMHEAEAGAYRNDLTKIARHRSSIQRSWPRARTPHCEPAACAGTSRR
jgi:hypothetical protein